MNLEETILPYFPGLTELQKEQFAALPSLYAEWNEKVNVVSRKDIQNLLERHVLHSLSIAKVVEFAPKAKILDLGTGGGFPGIPLAILFPEAHFHLVDSIGKKIGVVKEVAKALGLKNVEADHVRGEKTKRKYHFVVSRAVTNIVTLHHWVYMLIEKNDLQAFSNGLICLKGGDLKEEFQKFRHHHRFYEVSEFFKGEFFEAKKVVYVPM